MAATINCQRYCEEIITNTGVPFREVHRRIATLAHTVVPLNLYSNQSMFVAFREFTHETAEEIPIDRMS